MNNEELILKEYSYLVFHMVSKFYPNKIASKEDLIQTGYIGLLRAIRNFDDGYNVKFSTYASKCIYNAISKVMKKTKIQLNVDVDINTDEPDYLFEYLPDKLLDIDKEILYMNLQGFSYKQISEKIDKTKSWTKNRYMSIIKTLQGIHK